MRRKRKLPLLPLLGVGITGVVIVFLFGSFLFSSSQRAANIVNQFYSLEQLGNFSESWELFHPDMKEKFDQGSYIKDRAHVFIGHFGADTFTYTIEEQGEINGWKMSEDSSPNKVAYTFLVTQSYKGKYGTFNFQQEVYVVEHKGDWVILWDYNQ
jgi:hypothetical protein